MTATPARGKPFKAARADGRARTALISCRLIPGGAQAVTDAAKKAGITRAELMRRALSTYIFGKWPA